MSVVTPFDSLSFLDDISAPDDVLDAVFYPTSAILEVVADADASAEARAFATAELLVRHFFLKGTDDDEPVPAEPTAAV